MIKQRLVGKKMKTIKKDIQSGQFKQIYLLCGEEDYLKKYYRDELAESILPGRDSMNYAAFSGRDIDIPKLIDLAQTMPFFAERRLFLLENTGFFKTTAGEQLCEYFSDMADTAYFIFVEAEVDRRTKMYKTVQKHGYICEMGRQDEPALSRWVKAIAAKDSKEMSNSAAAYLVSCVGTDMESLRQETEKLICYAGERETLTRQDIDAICVKQMENHIFEMLDAAAAGDQRRAMQRYDELLALKEPPMRILFQLNRQFKNLYHVYLLKKQGLGKKEIAAKASLAPYAAGKLMRLTARFSADELRGMMEEGVQLEQDVKSGTLTDRLAVEIFLVDACRAHKMQNAAAAQAGVIPDRTREK